MGRLDDAMGMVRMNHARDLYTYLCALRIERAISRMVNLGHTCSD